MNSLLKKILVAVSFLAVVLVNGLANALPINGVTTGGVSDSFPNLFAPAGLTFSIWGLIYLLLAGFVLFYLGVFRKNKFVDEHLATLFIMTSIANIAWIFSWHFGFIGLSVLFMLCLLITLILIATRLRSLDLSLRERFLVRLPFSVYFGWITVATIANISVFLVSINWDAWGFSEAFWTMSILGIGAIIGLWRSYLDRDLAYILVFIWAYIGILIKHTSTSGFSGQYLGVITVLIICLAVFVSMALYQIYLLFSRQYRSRSKNKRS